ncbi:uncharacterized protein LOC124369339 isoform X2 [Homalodisca vitripennis]|uniref:uncharacterized protein LOC124369339 isoform X2 n=1 Tax=Homalodisca vitripennis TaxID=197043 RepID=UPI001EECEBD5|nr:uncharacterized protein LOC124369339 isoform X2 [Homalodisca vitripennis]
MSTTNQRTESPGDDHPSIDASNEEERPNVADNIQSPSTSTCLVPVVNDVNSSISEVPQEQPKNLQELLRLSTMLQSRYNEGESDSSSRPSTTNSDREDFLRNALANLSIDVVSNLQEQLHILSEITDGNQPITNLERYENTFDRIIDHVYNIDMANAIVGDNPEGIKQFKKHNGLKIVNHGLNSGNEKMIVKTAFLIMALCNTDPSMKDELLQIPIVENLLTLIRLTDTLSAEHLLGALLALIRNNEDAIKQCLRKELGVYAYLKQSISLTSNDESFQEYVTHANEFVQILSDYIASNEDMDVSTPEQSK